MIVKSERIHEKSGFDHFTKKKKTVKSLKEYFIKQKILFLEKKEAYANRIHHPNGNKQRYQKTLNGLAKQPNNRATRQQNGRKTETSGSPK